MTLSTPIQLRMCFLFAFLAATGIGQTPPTFGGPRIVKLDSGIHGVRSGDFDGDGKLDLAVVNNARAQVELLIQREGQEKADVDPERPNVPVDDPLFEKRSILTERKVRGFVTGDFDGDGRLDLAWYGDPRALVVAYQDEGGDFARRREFPIKDGSLHPSALQAADIDGNGKIDLVLLAERTVILIKQDENGLGEPERIPAALENVGYLELGDFNGDGRIDLLMVENAHESPLRVRFQRSDGGIGPEIAFRSPPLRVVRGSPSDRQNGLVMIPQASGTLRHVQIAAAAPKDNDLALGTVLLYPFGSRSAQSLALAHGDLDGDGRQEILVADPTGARVLLYHGLAEGGFSGPKPFPSYRNVSALRMADIDGDGRLEALVLSQEERAVGIHTWDGRRLTFPAPLPIEGTPLALEVADLDQDGLQDLVVAVKEKKETSGKTETRLWVRFGAKEGERFSTSFELDPTSEIQAIRAGDLDRDGRTDILLFVPYEAPRVFRGVGERRFEEIRPDVLYRQSNLPALTEPATCLADLDGDGQVELLFASQSYARSANIDERGMVAVLDQINGPAHADIIAAQPVNWGGDGQLEIALLDKTAKAVRLMRRSAEGVFEESRVLETGEFDFRGLLTGDFSGDHRDDLLILGSRKLGLVVGGGIALELREGPPYQSKERDAQLSLVAYGDLDGVDGPALVAIDVRNNRVEILSRKEDGYQCAFSWKVFEDKSFRAGTSGFEPHDVHVADVTGDGRADIILLAHDRVLVYPRQ